MFGEWNDNDWCQFDNYMIKCLQLYLDKGLLKSDFVTLKTRKFSAETSHEFIEWCGVIDGMKNPKLSMDNRIYSNDLYLDFTNEYPDYGPKAKMTVSRIRFGKWLVSYSNFKHGCNPFEGKDMLGKWIKFIDKSQHTLQDSLKV